MCSMLSDSWPELQAESYMIIIIITHVITVIIIIIVTSSSSSSSSVIVIVSFHPNDDTGRGVVYYKYGIVLEG